MPIPRTVQLSSRSVGWPEGEAPRITLPPEKLDEHGVGNRDKIPVTYEKETGELTYHLGEVDDGER